MANTKYVRFASSHITTPLCFLMKKTSCESGESLWTNVYYVRFVQTAMQKSAAIFSALKLFGSRLKAGRFLHMSRKPITKLTKRKYGMNMTGVKPKGLWYGIDGSWANWCVGNEWGGGRYFYELSFDTNRILHINNLKQFNAFEEEYACDSMLDRMLKDFGITPPKSMFMARAFGPTAIDWERLKKKYAGLEINPWFYEKHLESMWYYGWDCASGVIWDVSVVKQFRLFASYFSKEGKFIIQN